MEFRILGPLEVHSVAGPVRIGGRRQVRLLSLLLVAAGRTVTTATAVDNLWDDPPATARAQLQNTVWALRRQLGPGSIRNDLAGYRLDLDGTTIDAAGFDRLAARATSHAARSDPDAAAADARAALAMWRGPVLAGVDMPAVDAERTRLGERRLLLMEHYADLQLAAGHNHEVAKDLSDWVRANPLRERLVDQLMVALWRSGRQVDALEAFHRLRLQLDDELGVEPRPECRRTYEAILRGEDPGGPARRPAHAWGAPANPVPPAQLPADPPAFTGRRDHLDRLDAILVGGGEPTATTSAAVVTGAGGIGKTALAVHWAHRIRGRFPHGQLYLDLQGYAPGVAPLTPMDALVRLLRTLGVATDEIPADLDEAAALYRSLLAGTHTLVLLDNARNSEQVRPLLPGGTGCLALVTSRDRMSGLIARDGAHLVILGLFTPAEATELLDRLLSPEHGSTRVAELARRCGYLPLALRVAAANVITGRFPDVATYLAALSTENPLNVLTVDGEGRTALRAAFDLSVASLDTDLGDLFRLLGLVPGPDVSVAAVAALADVDPATASRLLDRLVLAHLLEHPAPGRYRLHDLLRLYAAELADRDDGRAALHRLFNHYLDHADVAARTLYPHILRLPRSPTDPDRPPVELPDRARALAWLEDERSNLVAAITYTATHGTRSVAWKLADALRGFFSIGLWSVDWRTAAEAALRAATAAGDGGAQASAELSIGMLHWRHGDLRKVLEHYDRALAHARRIRWTDAEAATVGNIGAVRSELGDIQGAVDHFTEALALHRRSGRRAGQAAVLSNLGVAHLALGRLSEAADYTRQAIDLYRQIGSVPGAAIAIGNLGELNQLLGRLDRAERDLNTALRLHREVGNRGDEADTLTQLAAVHRDGARPARALELASDGLRLARSCGHRTYEAGALTVRASIRSSLGDHRRAVEDDTEALRIAQDIANRYVHVRALVGLAAAHLHLGHLDRTGACLDQAVDIAQRSRYRALEGQALGWLARLHLRRGDRQLAADTAQAALVIHRETGLAEGVKELRRLVAEIRR